MQTFHSMKQKLNISLQINIGELFVSQQLHAINKLELRFVVEKNKKNKKFI